jgi:hypothetical protein
MKLLEAPYSDIRLINTQNTFYGSLAKGKEISAQAWTDPDALRFPDNQHNNWLLLPSRKYSWYSFLLETELNPGPLCDRMAKANEKTQYHNRESNP